MPALAEPTAVVRYTFGRFELQPGERRLLDDGRVVDIGARAFDLLVALVEEAPRLVGKDALLARAWPGLVVEEGNLQVQVSALRKAIGVAAVGTVAGHGYRFALDVTRHSGAHARLADKLSAIPRALTAFVGREEEVAAQGEAMARTRLLTITGGAGLGKTRLAFELANQVGEGFADGVRLVELAAVTDTAHVMMQVGAALGVANDRGGSLRDAVIEHLSTREILLLLDNCEHVIEDAAALAKTVLQRAARVRILATSREPLRISGETVHGVAPLGLPAASTLPVVDEASQCASVRLFLSRARAADPAFELSVANAPAIFAICRRLEGIPLAIELAAARLRTLSPQAIERRLDDRFRFLTDGERTALPRHQTLRNAIEWSYDLLPSAERRAFTRLAVWSGGFTLQSAEAVLGSDDAVELVMSLVDKSLVIADAGNERYRMLETVRDFALAQLAVAGSEQEAYEAHMTHHLALAERAEKELIGPQQAVWYDRLAQERENMLAALAACASYEAFAQQGLRLACALRMYWQSRGPLTVGYEITVRALAAKGAAPRNFVRCQAAFTAAILAYYLGRVDALRSHTEESFAIARELDDRAKMSDCLVLAALALAASGDLEAARSSALQAAALARELGDDVRLLQAHSAMGEFAAGAHRYEEAERSYAECLRLARAVGELGTVGGTLTNVARIALQVGDAVRGASTLVEAAEVIAATGAVHQSLQWFAIAGAFAVDRGEPERAACLFDALRARSLADGFALEAVDDEYVAPRLARLGGVASGRIATSDEHTLAETVQWLRSITS